MKSVEFLYFYLMPEAPAEMTGMKDGGSRRLASGAQWPTGLKNGRDLQDTRTIEEKQDLLGRYMSNVQDLVEDLRESMPFGAAF